MRPGIFEQAVARLNLLQPEFVMSVGDLIEGYTEDRAQLDHEWREFDDFVAGLEMPFFYLAGNHDYSNAVMADIWRTKFGRTAYHFVYGDVLFVCLNSEAAWVGEDYDDQLRMLDRVLSRHRDARWTMVFIHKPLWLYADSENSDKHRAWAFWDQVERRLRGRRHTVFAGHYHNYRKHVRHQSNYFVLATTGGASKLRGPQFGEFDHVVWVTMTDQGPRLANLILEGIWDENIRTDETAAALNTLWRRLPIRAEPVVIDDPAAGLTRLRLRVTNDYDVPMRVTAKSDTNTTVQIGDAGLTVPPNSVEFVDLPVQFSTSANQDTAFTGAVDFRLKLFRTTAPHIEISLRYERPPGSRF